MAGNKQSEIQVWNRRMNLARIIMYEYKAKNKSYTNKQLLQDLKDKRYEIDRTTLWRDIQVIMDDPGVFLSQQTVDLKALFEETYPGLTRIESELWEWLKDPPMILKRKTMRKSRVEGRPPKVFIIVETMSPFKITDMIMDILKIRIRFVKAVLRDKELPTENYAKFTEAYEKRIAMKQELGKYKQLEKECKKIKIAQTMTVPSISKKRQ